jgi:hypothetical protein
MTNGRCRLHGGLTPVGAALPQFKNGKHSKYMPARLLERYRDGIADPELLSLRSDIALTDARLSDVLERVDTGESGHAWNQAKDAYKLLMSTKPGDSGIGKIMLGEIINKGLADYAAWHEVGDLLEQRRRLVESEQKRLVAAQQMVTTEQVMTFITAIVDSVRRNVSDQSILNAISLDISKLISMPSGVNKT